MLKDITAVKLLDRFCLHIVFEDDVEGTVDIQELIDFTGIFFTACRSRVFSLKSVSIRSLALSAGQIMPILILMSCIPSSQTAHCRLIPRQQ